MSNNKTDRRIKHIIETERLFLAWQSSDKTQSRTRCIVAELTLQKDGNVQLLYLNNTADFGQAKLNGFINFPAFKITDKVYDLGVLDTFMLRMPQKSRPDYPKFLDALRLPRKISISDFALLGYSEARLPGDGFSIIHPFYDTSTQTAYAPCELLTEVAGYRHYLDESVPIPYGAKLAFEPEPDNSFDTKAIKITLDKKLIGYVNRGQTDAFRYWLEHNTVNAWIETKNGRADRIRVLMFVEVS